MEYLNRQWKRRTTNLLLLAVVVGLAMWMLELTDWAASINAQAAQIEDAGGGGAWGPPESLRAILPFVKLSVFILAPASIVVGTRALYASSKRESK